MTTYMFIVVRVQLVCVSVLMNVTNTPVHKKVGVAGHGRVCGLMCIAVGTDCQTNR